MVSITSRHALFLMLFGWLFLSCATLSTWESLTNLADDYDVTIYRDTWGVPHIFGPTDTDVAFGLAYAHAEDDLENIEFSLLAARGIIASRHGLSQLPIDFLVKLFKLNETVEEKYENDLSRAVRRICEAYANGINYYAALHPGEADAGLYPVSGRDIVAGVSLKTTFFFGLDDVLRKLMRKERPETIVTSAEDIHLAHVTDEIPIGSNGFAISPRKTADGGTFFMSNTHQPWKGPLAWYEAHVHSGEGWKVSGALFPGMPVFGVGHDDNKGWTHTVNRPDLIDVYELEINPSNKNQYRYDGQWRELERFDIPIKAKLFGPLSWTFRREGFWSAHGPVIHRPFGTFAIRHANLTDIRAVDQWYRMNKSENFEQFRQAMEMTAVPSFNTVYADKDGNIFYVYNGRFPKRDEAFNWNDLLPGDTSAVVWDQFLPLSEIPQVMNPESGFVQSCNHTPFMSTGESENPDSSLFSHTMGIETHVTNRALRARDILTADDSLTFDEFLEAKYDLSYSPESKYAELWGRIISSVETDDPLTTRALALMVEWDYRTSVDSKEAAVCMLTLREVGSYLRRGSDLPDGETMEKAVHTAAQFLMKYYGRLDVPYGEVQRHIRGDENHPLAGGPDVLRAIYSYPDGNGQLVGQAGDSYILAVHWDREGNMTSFSGHPFGSATIDEASPHYDDQSPLFARHELKPVWLKLEDIKANLESAYQPGEEN
ncbi:MAG: penicillin amidase [Candidatus Marinimicrobia bacterium]|nr:penicillin amidase [Candidatus Neomarinimicrobiota bacterium]